MPNYFALIPAAGYGARMDHQLPKQYLPLAGKPMIYHAINTLCRSAAINRVFVVLSPEDPEWRKHDWSGFDDKLTVLYHGGATRAESVCNGLAAASKIGLACPIDDEDWILVHDAARPLFTQSQLNRLIAEIGDDPVGGLLAVPVADTLKRSGGDKRVVQTESRENLWQAQTPQMFRYRMLLNALSGNTQANVTDDASAIEALGLHPRLVHNQDFNFKVTYPQDLELAELIMQKRNHQ
jgi:2-C-methyl-D-erythritol 4-phosphate cytidylyltransferase